jgi:hypothetical protein
VQTILVADPASTLDWFAATRELEHDTNWLAGKQVGCNHEAQASGTHLHGTAGECARYARPEHRDFHWNRSLVSRLPPSGRRLERESDCHWIDVLRRARPEKKPARRLR